jgi:exonuclease SbcC
MKPLLLSFAGIRSYPGTIGPLDFTGKTLIAILGDTGAGKSTILEAITLGLYGNCTWTDGEHRALMAEGAAQMSVDFTFSHDGQRWRVRRIFHANTTPATHLLQNLDTGEQIDGARAVNHRIETLLQLRFSSFRTAVLLPQGQFDRLLTATGAVRTTLLKGIFGVESIERVRDLADRHRDQLNELIHRARLSRHGLLDNPAASAAQAAEDAEQAERLAEHLNSALTDLRAWRDQASHASARHQKLAAASLILDRHKKRDVTTELTRICQAADALAALEAAADQDEKDCQDKKAKADAELAAAAGEGLTYESLASAGTVLDAMPGRLEDLAADQVQLDSDIVHIAEQAQQLEAAKPRLSELKARAGLLAKARIAAESALDEYRTACERLQDSSRIALLEAARTGQALQEEADALQQLRERQEAVTPLETAATSAATELQSADERLSVIRDHDWAHAAGAGLSPGEKCLICRRPLPDDYQVPAPADPRTLRTAEQARNEAKKADKEATDNLAQARADVGSAEKDYASRQAAARRAQARLEQAKGDAAAAMRNLTQRRWGDGIQSSWEDFEARLGSACARITQVGSDEQDTIRDTSARELLGPARALEKVLADAATAADDAARNGEGQAARAADKLLLQQTTHGQAQDRLEEACRRHESAWAKLSRDLEELPQLARQQIPGSAHAVTPGQIDVARQILTERQGQLDALGRDRDSATTQLGRLATSRRQLDQRRNREVTGPLHTLATYLERWHDVIIQAASALPGNQPAAPMPTSPSAITAKDVRAYADALAVAAGTVQAAVSTSAVTADNEANAQLRKLDAMATRLRAGHQGFPAIALGEGDELLDPAALDLVVAAQANATDASGRYRASQKAATDQIEPADQLDSAISAGQARLSAVTALRSLLGEGKFLQYLTDKRTHALLGVASDNFGRLSGGEFGFAEDFQIVSRYSGATRSPKTLSGGETFLASLALALALVELHSRSGARLGALFLDEGFASLDVDALGNSLSMLHAETGEDKLVAVISHLHAVAEAVEDVIWVERQPEGSSARWLAPSERDALARQEVTGGLLNLI